MNKKIMEKVFGLCLKKARVHMEQMGEDYREVPPCEDGNFYNPDLKRQFPIEHIINWTSSFPIGMAYIAYHFTKDEALLKWAENVFPLYKNKVYDNPIAKTMHDIGFLYSPYSIASYNTTGNMAQRELAIKAADELAKRYLACGRFIKSWGRMDNDLSQVEESLRIDPFYAQNNGLAIIDCLMNLPLLFWAGQQTNNPYYEQIANAHLDTVINNYFREDGTMYHTFRFNEETGEPIRGNALEQAPDTKYWARGNSWAIYGFAIAYRYTKNEKYKDAFFKVTDAFISYSDERGLLCDNMKNIKEGDQSREISASVIACCGIVEMLEMIDNQALKDYSEKIINTITSDECINYDLNISGILNFNQKGYTTWGDYYLMELLARILHKYETCW